MKLQTAALFRFTILLFSLCLSTAFFSGCNHLLYPAERQAYIAGKYLKPVPQDIYIPVNEAEKIHAWYFPAQSKIKKGAVLHFHGNGQNLTTHFQFFSWMTQFGFEYVIFDYRGYGSSSGEQATQEKTVQDGLAALQYMKDTFKDLPLMTIGQSLGSNVLIRTLQDADSKILPDLVVLDSSFLSYQQAARSIVKQRWFLYPLVPFTYLAIDDNFSAYVQIKKTPPLPAVFFHGTTDTIISSDLGKENFDFWPGPKTLVLNEGGAHTAAFGDPRFIDSREILIGCFDMVISKSMDQFAKCDQK
jgi:pimeloyl-ACP methyl ester carboxylesterase